MSYSRRYSRPPSPYKRYHVENPGNNLYVRGLSDKTTIKNLKKHFSSQGKVEDVHLLLHPRSGVVGFVTMSTVVEAERCIDYLDRSVLQGCVIMVEKAKRRRGRSPTPGRYRGLRTLPGRLPPSLSYSPYLSSRSFTYSPYSPYSPYHSSGYSYCSSERGSSRSSSNSPYYYSRGRRSYSSCSYSSYYSRRCTSVSREWSYSPSPSPYSRSSVSRHGRYRDYSPDDHYYRRNRYRSVSRSISPRGYSRPRRSYSRSISPRLYRSVSRSISPRGYSCSRRSYSRGISSRHAYRRRYSPSVSPSMSPPRTRRSYGRRGYSRNSYSSRSTSPYSSSPSRSASP